MSTTDPAAQRREHQRRRAGDPRFLAAAIACAAAMTAFAFLVGLAIAVTADLLRHSIIDSIFDERLGFQTFWGIGTLGYLWTLGTFGLIAGGASAAWLLDAYRGGEQRPQILPSLAACAVALAVVLNAPLWLDPLQVGTAVDPVFHEDEPWSVFGWIAYYADLWLPALAVAVAVLVVASSIQHHRRLRAQIAARDRLLATGRRTRGSITDVTLRTSVNDQGQRSVVGADVTVKFTDDHGVARWVTRLSRDRSAMPGTGFAEVLFDPRQPGDDDLIFVAFHPDPTPAEWIGTVL